MSQFSIALENIFFSISSQFPLIISQFPPTSEKKNEVCSDNKKRITAADTYRPAYDGISQVVTQVNMLSFK